VTAKIRGMSHRKVSAGAAMECGGVDMAFHMGFVGDQNEDLIRRGSGDVKREGRRWEGDGRESRGRLRG